MAASGRFGWRCRKLRDHKDKAERVTWEWGEAIPLRAPPEMYFLCSAALPNNLPNRSPLRTKCPDE